MSLFISVALFRYEEVEVGEILVLGLVVMGGVVVRVVVILRGVINLGRRIGLVVVVASVVFLVLVNCLKRGLLVLFRLPLWA